MQNNKELLEEGLNALNLPTNTIPSLLRYSDLLLEKNQVMNLTAIKDPMEVVTLHFLDSATLLNKIPLAGKKLIDVGTGAGFPGMVLKIEEPACEVTLLDSLGKRIDWLHEVSEELVLTGIHCVHARAEDYAKDHREFFDIATSRAVAALNVLSELCLPLVHVGGVFVAMKSLESDEEIKTAHSAIRQLGGQIKEIVDYTIPTTDIKHRLVVIQKVQHTPAQFPRSFTKIKKQPLI